MEIIGIKTRIFKEGEDLTEFIAAHVPLLEEGDLLVITSKIVALSQNRIGHLKDKKELIVNESKKVIETPWALLTLTKEGWCINAGVDESNAGDKLILAPRQPEKTAQKIQKLLSQKFSLRSLGILITDSKSLPLRKGTIGRAMAYAGFKPLKNYIGKKDLFGRKTRHTESNAADALAASAVLIMGEGKEQTPLAIIKGAPIEFTKQSQMHNLSLAPTKDIYAKIFLNQVSPSNKQPKKKRL